VKVFCLAISTYVKAESRKSAAEGGGTGGGGCGGGVCAGGSVAQNLKRRQQNITARKRNG